METEVSEVEKQLKFAKDFFRIMGLYLSTTEPAVITGPDVLHSKPNKHVNDSIGTRLVMHYANNLKLSSVISNDLLLLINAYFGKEFIDILKFSAIANTNSHHHLSRLHDNNTCIEIVADVVVEGEAEKKINEAKPKNMRTQYVNFGVVFVTAKHEYEGVHCWRVDAYNPNRGDVTYGVTHPANCRLGSVTDSMFESRICGASCRKVACQDNAKYHLSRSGHQSESEFDPHRLFVDILLDLDAGKLTLYLCALCLTESQTSKGNVSMAVEIEIGSKRNEAWTPFIFYRKAKGAQFRMAKIPSHLFSKKVPIWTD